MFCSGPNSENERDQILTQYLVKETIGGLTVYKCQICGHSSANNKSNVINHIESLHFPNLFTYPCKFCGEEKKTKKSLIRHVSNYHQEEKRMSVDF